jgi:hypothetical protein
MKRFLRAALELARIRGLKLIFNIMVMKEIFNRFWVATKDRLKFKRARALWAGWPKKKKIFFLIGGPLIIFVVGVLIYYSLALTLVSAGEVRLAALKESYEKEEICHEACALARRGVSEKITEILAEDKGMDSKTARRLRAYFLDENLDLEFRAELAAILFRATEPGNPPEYVFEYLVTGAEDYLRAAIINIYGLDPEIAFLFLDSEEKIEIKLAAIRALSNYPDKQGTFSAAQLALIRGLALDSATDQRLRQPLVLLLSDYYPLFPEETRELLKVIYDSQNAVDEISQAFAADLYNRFKTGDEEELILPEISEAQWEEYYNN